MVVADLAMPIAMPDLEIFIPLGCDSPHAGGAAAEQASDNE
jgi:hypothetical protein